MAFSQQKSRSEGKGGLGDLARVWRQWGVDLGTLPICRELLKADSLGCACQPIAGLGTGGQTRVEAGTFRSCHRPYKSVYSSCEMEMVLCWNVAPLGTVLRSSSFVGCN